MALPRKQFVGKIDNKTIYDFIYVDANHTADAVASDAEYSWGLLKKGGILAFDDYQWGKDLPPDTTPKPAIDNFLQTHTGEYTQLVDSYQVWIKKNDN
jgi:predicted O-methyltransferase YrrM